MKRSALKRKSSLRGRPVQHSFSEPGRAEWKRPQSGRCAVCGKWFMHLHHHHIYPETKVRREGGHPWAPVNGMYICELCHTRHHSAFRRIPMVKVPMEARQWLVRLIGRERAEDFFQRTYENR